jgi:hypothetical protein
MKYMKYAAFLFMLCVGSIPALFADKGQMWPVPVNLSEPSQNAIILHNKKDEILILGTTLQADREADILEFIPFPSEPKVSTPQGDPFKAADRLIKAKGLQFVEQSKGQVGPSAVSVVFEGKLGLHDVTIVRILDISGFADWVHAFFRNKGIALALSLDAAVENADDYVKRGFSYFVFDYVRLGSNPESIAPLVYQFASRQLYYPFKTSNITGKEGTANLILILPGSLGLLQDRSDIRALQAVSNSLFDWDLSSSAKLYPQELADIVPEAQKFFVGQKMYLQVLRYAGPYSFENDLLFDISNIAPFAYRHILYTPDYGNPLGGNYSLVGNLSKDELADIAEAYKIGANSWFFDPEILSLIQ